MNRVLARRRPRSRMLAAGLTAVLAVAAPTLAACGSSGSTGAPSVSASATPSETGSDLADMSAKEVIAAVRDAVGGQSSVRIVADVEGASLDVVVARGVGGLGTVDTEGLAFEFIAVGGSFYIKGSQELYDQIAPGAAGLLADKWLTDSSEAGSLDEIESFGDMDALLEDELLEPLYDGQYTFTVGEPTEFRGIPVIGLTTTESDVGEATLWISLEGDPLPVALDGGDSGVIEFRDWSAPVEIAAPPASDVVDLAELL